MMDIAEATRILRREFAAWENRLDRFFLARYSLLVDKPPKDSSRLRHRLRQFLVFLRLIPPRVIRRAWLPTLKHRSSTSDAKTLLIWALGMERDSLRNACLGFQQFLASRQNLAPVLVTGRSRFCLVFASGLDGGIPVGT